MWRRICITAATFLALSSPLAAQNQTEEKYRYWEITPHFGYRTDISFTTDQVVDGVVSKIKFDGGASYGFAVGGRFNDEDVVEFRWIRQNSKVRFTPALTPSSDVHLDQFHLDFSHEYEVVGWLEGRPYVMASIGATRISASEFFPGFTRFSFGMGAGLKVFPSPGFGFKVQAQWIPIVFNPKATAFCLSGCVIHFGGKLGNQVELTAGPSFRF
jgi:hypothetical protein